MPHVESEIYSEAVLADPYSYYGQLREQDPVHWNDQYQTWFVTRYEHVVWLLRHPEYFSSETFKRDRGRPAPPITPGHERYLRQVTDFRQHELIQNDPPEHARLRTPLNRTFTPAALEDWRPRVAEIVEHLLDRVVDTGGMDVVHDLGKPLPLYVVSEMLGLPEDDRPMIKDQADQRMAHSLSLEPDRMCVASTGIEATSEYLDGELDRRHECPQEDILTTIAKAEDTGKYSRMDALANAQGLIDAGHETTIQLICNGLLAFLRNPDQWQRFCASPEDLAGPATEECLRYDPPLPAPRRIAAQDIELDGKQIREGDRVVYVIAAANRDPRVYDEPNRFDIERTPNKHLAFGSGMHYCLGQALARIEGQEVFKTVARRIPDLQLSTDEIAYAPLRGVRSLMSLKVSWPTPA